MNRTDVYKVIDTEREYQIKETVNPDRPDMVEEFGLGQAMFAIQAIMNQAAQVWYKDTPVTQYENTMHYVRKIAGVCVQMGEKYGMPERKL